MVGAGVGVGPAVAADLPVGEGELDDGVVGAEYARFAFEQLHGVGEGGAEGLRQPVVVAAELAGPALQRAADDADVVAHTDRVGGGAGVTHPTRPASPAARTRTSLLVRRVRGGQVRGGRGRRRQGRRRTGEPQGDPAGDGDGGHPVRRGAAGAGVAGGAGEVVGDAVDHAQAGGGLTPSRPATA